MNPRLASVSFERYTYYRLAKLSASGSSYLHRGDAEGIWFSIAMPYRLPTSLCDMVGQSSTQHMISVAGSEVTSKTAYPCKTDEEPTYLD